MRMRFVSLALAVIVMFVAIGGMVFKGFNFALDFTGGYETEVQFSKTVDTGALRGKLEQTGFKGAQVRVIGSSNEVVIRMQAQESGKRIDGSTVVAAVQSADNPATLRDYYYVGPQVGKELAESGLQALIFVVVGFLFYVWIRFELKFAIAAIITTLHDVVLVAGTLLTFIPAAGDYVNAQILGSPNTKMIGNVIESRYFKIVDYPTAAALSFTLMAAILILVTIYIRKAGTEELV